MSKTKRRIKQAAARGVHVIFRGSFGGDFYPTQRDKFDIYVESEGPLGPRDLALSKREAAHLAYSIFPVPSTS